MPAPTGLHRFNTASPSVAEAALLGCCGSRRWATHIIDRRPYPDMATLLVTADEAARAMTEADLSEALADESQAPQPLTGLRLHGNQAAHTALRAAHAAYESRFGHAFVVSLDGCPPEEVLDRVLTSLHTRLYHTPEQERPVAARELHRIARNRLEHLIASPTLTGSGSPAT
ncbi:OHCU decarboxylase [Wenjunlia vitaminophila]|uniref:2-oxo-4-hydroxy-4-carboxy-5-ureidoimidazoline decarboxylase n=1 Tax=Wenjunlia vitaminophila TaxID=76728 RepID=A0A0T6LLG6_WENVI|nr:2-oxo-4-hydroxy-4-carboxy-5-ureidoimidazoline decarboxylase [Wenjunlia vitaminophila]KRV46906.1 OHCU decarboxylase [Wenjunlia vitaminophila]